MTKRGTVSATLALLALSVLVPAVPARASTEANTWLRVNIPAESSTGGWVLAPGSDVQRLTLAADGTLYASANPTGTTYTLFRSTDSGATWSATGGVSDNIVAITIARDDVRVVYYATPAAVYRSSDAAGSFVLLAANPGGAGSGNIEITALDVPSTGLGNRTIVVGTRDTDSGQYGGVYTLNESVPFIWTNTSIGSYDVYAVAASPAFPADRELVAVVTDETDSFVMTRVGDSPWGSVTGHARLNPDSSTTPVAVTRGAAIAFPEDYEATPLDQRVRFVAIDSGSGRGDVYRVDSGRGKSLATDLNAGAAYGLGNVDVSSVAVSGSSSRASLLAGAASSAQAYFSPDGGRSWTRAAKEPTGQSRTEVVMAPRFATQGKAYAVTRGAESAVSYTADKGNTWNQFSLIDTRITSIVDLSPSPNYSQDRTLFLLTRQFGGKDSLWRSLSGGNQWERVYCSTVAGGNISRVALSPQYGTSGRVVFLAGDGGAPAVWQSGDNGQTFARRVTRKPLSAGTFPIDAWVLADNNILLVGSYDGSSGMVYASSNGGSWYATEAVAGTNPLYSIALSPDYPRDRSVLAGSSAGRVYHSSDDGKSFALLPPDAAAPSLTGDVSVAFDPAYVSNRTLYAASSTADKGVYRYIVGKSTDWERIDSTMPAGGMLGQVAVSPGGVLYASNFKADGGMERSLDPTYPLAVSFETVTRGLAGGAVLNRLWIRGTTLFAADTANARVVTYADGLTQAVKPVSPDTASATGTLNNYSVIGVSLDWQSLSAATSYRWQLNPGTDFSTVPAGFQGVTEGSSVRLPPLDPATKYYWRVRAEAPVSSPWSPTASFTTVTGTESLAPAVLSPGSAAAALDVRPVFQWSAVPQGQRYELLVAADSSFANPAVARTGERALPATAWQSDTNLNPGTTYYWKVRAVHPAGFSPWSAVSAFTTRPATTTVPVVAAPSPLAATPQIILVTPPPAPAPQSVVDTPDWVKLVVGGLILIVFLQLVVIFALVLTMRKS